ncbi:hypothetical protein BSNK01_28600 [Bacillaceae bacterium]
MQISTVLVKILPLPNSEFFEDEGGFRLKISSRGEYALRALLVLGRQPGRVFSIQEIAEQTLVTVKYLEQILLQLKKLGYVQSKRGIQGGYMLCSPPEDINIGEVIRQLEGPLSPMGCASVTAYEPCALEEGCLLKPLWTLVRDTIARVLEQTTLEDLLQKRIMSATGGEELVKK